MASPARSFLPDGLQIGSSQEATPVSQRQGRATVHDVAASPRDQSQSKPAQRDSHVSARDSSRTRNRASTATTMFSDSTPRRKGPDDFIMDTNNSSIVSKRSVEKLYYAGQPEYFRHFVTKFKRRSPLINRGYWLRMKSIEHAVTRFLAEQITRRKFVVNLGCGYDTLPFYFLGRHVELCENTVFVDVDYPALMQHKMDIIGKAEQLTSLLPDFAATGNDAGLLGSSDAYAAVGCDLRNIDQLNAILRDELHVEEPEIAILFVAEVSIAYMDRESSQAVLEWASSYRDVRFCLLEQHLPDGRDHPFAQTMLAHFEKLRTPLHTVGSMEAMKDRFISARWPEHGIESHSLWELWSEPTFISPEQRRALDAIEPFDEWEEFALFASHYLLLLAERKADQDYTYRPHRASLAASRLSVSQSPLAGVGSDPLGEVDPSNILIGLELATTHVPRRFAALVPPAARAQDGDATGLHGGMGMQERLDDCSTYSWFVTAQRITGPPLRHGLMCHTITRLGGTSNCMLAGGRTSPDRALADCWLRLDGQWEKAPSLPEGRYRHCAVPLRLPTEPRPAHTVLIYGGKTGNGQVLDEWLLWTGESDWQNLRVVGDHPCARFGAAMITDKAEGISGIIVGGMTSAGRVLNDFWHWNLQPDMSVTCQNVTARATAVLKNNASTLGRFGAQLVRSDQGILLVGGVAGGRMLTRHDEILNMRAMSMIPVRGARQLYVGCSVADVDGGILVLGGGATCFSFGTYWNKSCILTKVTSRQEDMTWQLVSGVAPSVAEPKTLIVPPNALVDLPTVKPLENGHTAVSTTHSPGHAPSSSNATMIPRVQLTGHDDFQKYLDAGQPVVISGSHFGRCSQSWTTQYLKEAIGADRQVVVHSSPTEKMDFKTKNFSYVPQDFVSFINAAERGEKVYLRSLSKDAPSEEPANLATDFPEIAPDFHLPDELAYVVANLHSSPLRISGPITMWLHYDVMANILCQIRGKKRVVLFPPSDVANLGFEPGSSSSSLEILTPDSLSPPLATHPHEAILEPGDALFIPPTWPHTTTFHPTTPENVAPDVSVAVNCFFRSMTPDAYAAGRDVYGNRDPAAYERARKDVGRIVKSFDPVPPHVAAFYLERLANELLDKARVARASAGEKLHDVYAELG